MNNKILSLLGFATKAGKLGFGFEACVQSIKSSKSQLVLVAEDISLKSLKEIRFFAEKKNIKYFILKGIDIKALSAAIGRKCGIVSVNEVGFAKALEKVLIEGGFANDK